MRYNTSVASINMQADFLDGASRKDSTRQWIQSLSNRLGTTDDGSSLGFRLYAPLEGATFHATAEYDNTPTNTDLLRLYCHYVLEHLPEKGVIELVESLEDLIDFYAEEARPLVKSAHSTQKSIAKIGEKRVSDPIYLPEV